MKYIDTTIERRTACEKRVLRLMQMLRIGRKGRMPTTNSDVGLIEDLLAEALADLHAFTEKDGQRA